MLINWTRFCKVMMMRRRMMLDYDNVWDMMINGLDSK